MSFFNKIGALFGSKPDTSPAVSHALSVIEESLGQQLLDLPDSRERLYPAVIHALDYFDATIAALPGPIDIAPASHGSDPRIQALFPSADDIGLGLGRSMALRDSLGWFSDHGHETVYAMMGLRLRPPENGGSAGPADHTFRSLGGHDRDVRECLREAAFAALIKGYTTDLKEKLREWRLRHTEQKLRNELRSRGEDGADEPIAFHPPQSGDQFTLGGVQESLIAWLRAPERQLRIDAHDESVFVPALAAGERPFHLPQLTTADRRKWLVCLVRFPLLDAMNAVARETRPHRYILI